MALIIRAKCCKSNTKKFSLIELLIVISVIAILLSILLPSLARAREYSRRLLCLSNLHQMSIKVAVYADNNDQQFCDFGIEQSRPYVVSLDFPTVYELQSPDVMCCPSVYGKRSYLGTFRPFTPVLPGNMVGASYNVYIGFNWFLNSVKWPEYDKPLLSLRVPIPHKTTMISDRQVFKNSSTFYLANHNFVDLARTNPIDKGFLGQNEVFFDCHAEWVRRGELTERVRQQDGLQYWCKADD